MNHGLNLVFHNSLDGRLLFLSLPAVITGPLIFKDQHDIFLRVFRFRVHGSVLPFVYFFAVGKKIGKLTKASPHIDPINNFPKT
jgi:hypothetical protein